MVTTKNLVVVRCFGLCLTSLMHLEYLRLEIMQPNGSS